MQKFLNKEFNGLIQNQKLKIYRPLEFQQHLTSLEGQAIRITVEKAKKQRSNNENRYYWGVVIQLIADHTGSSPEDVHNHLKIEFLRIGGDKIPLTRSTTDLSTVEMEDYLSKCRIWASRELGIYVPEPNEVDKNYNY